MDGVLLAFVQADGVTIQMATDETRMLTGIFKIRG